jgi:restriction endonuclease Mrr
LHHLLQLTRRGASAAAARGRRTALREASVIPDYQPLMAPTLAALADGQDKTPAVVREILAEALGLQESRKGRYAEALKGSRAARTRSRPKLNSSAGS